MRKRRGSELAAFTRIEVTGIDFSESGIIEAHRAYPGLRLALGSAYDDLAARMANSP